jgi:hypothetical protein
MSTRFAAAYPARVAGALLCLAVAYIHVKDQGGIPGDKSPGYVAIGYYLLEVAGVLAAVLLLATRKNPQARMSWLLAAGVAFGPFLGYVLSRGPGLPGYTDDKGNWTETLGVVSLVIEGVLLVLALVALMVASRAPAISANATSGASAETVMTGKHRDA